MQVTPETPRTTLAIGGSQIAVPYVFAAGHTLSDNEAAFLNRAVASRVANTYNQRVKAALEELDAANRKLIAAKDDAARYDTNDKGKQVPHAFTKADLGWTDEQARFDALFADYEVGRVTRGEGGSRRQTIDPVEKYTNVLAGEKVKELLAAHRIPIRATMQAKSTKYAGDSKYQELVRDYIAANPQIVEVAKAQAEAAASISAGSLDLSGLEPEQQAAA